MEKPLDYFEEMDILRDFHKKNLRAQIDDIVRN
jgi:hypothetical protein